METEASNSPGVESLAQELHSASFPGSEWRDLSEGARNTYRRQAQYLLAKYQITPYPVKRVGKALAVLIPWLVASVSFAGPVEAYGAATQDARANQASYQMTETRYLWQPGGFTDDQLAVANIHLNLLSKEADIVRPRRVSAELISLQLYEYGMTAETWDKVAEADTYFHDIASVQPGKQIKVWFRGDAKYPRGFYDSPVAKVEKRFAVPAVGMDYFELIKLCNTSAPILRADWFFSQTAVSEDRAVGYYGVMGLKNRDDVEKLAGVDKAKAEQRRKIQLAVVTNSGVAVNNRQIQRMQAFDGPYWFTLDAEQNVGQRNAVRLLNGDFKHDAEEIYGTLPNGLPLMAASGADGKLQKTVPSKIATDFKATGNDRNIHVPLGCMRCHVEVIRPFSCTARQLYRGEIRLESVDITRFIRLKRLYLSDIDTPADRDRAGYALAIKLANGLTPAANAKSYEVVWHQYMEIPLSPARAAEELGIGENKLFQVIQAKVKLGLSDPVLSGLYQVPPIPIRREHWEEVQTTIRRWSREAEE